MSNLLSNAECGPSNALSTLSKYSQQDKTLQQDRWVQGTGRSTVSDFSSTLTIRNPFGVQNYIEGRNKRPCKEMHSISLNKVSLCFPIYMNLFNEPLFRRDHMFLRMTGISSSREYISRLPLLHRKPTLYINN